MTSNSSGSDRGARPAAREQASGVSHARFGTGQLVRHRRFGYRGVIFDIDPVFSLSDEWYERVARSRPPRDEPWYHVLVHEATHTTYVAERNLEADPASAPIHHPLINEVFTAFDGVRYRRDAPLN